MKNPIGVTPSQTASQLKSNLAKYSTWIKKHYPDGTTAYGYCKEAAEKMLKAFPELIVTNGFVHVYAWNRDRQHWWLKTSKGEIVDPSKNQFPGLIDYEEVDDSHPVRNFDTCLCAHCGKTYYLTEGADRTVCGEACFKSFADSLNRR